MLGKNSKMGRNAERCKTRQCSNKTSNVEASNEAKGCSSKASSTSKAGMKSKSSTNAKAKTNSSAKNCK